MTDIGRVGIDLAKKIFHVTAVDENGNVLERKCLRRAGLHSYLTTLPAGCEVGMEACASAHHHWGRLAARCPNSPVAPWPRIRSNAIYERRSRTSFPWLAYSGSSIRSTSP